MNRERNRILREARDTGDFTLLESAPAATEIVLTGRYAPDALADMADYVTEMREVKHPFQNGTAQRKGIEY